MGTKPQLKDDRLSLLITEHIDDVGYLFKAGEKTQLSSKDDLSFLLN